MKQIFLDIKFVNEHVKTIHVAAEPEINDVYAKIAANTGLAVASICAIEVDTCEDLSSLLKKEDIFRNEKAHIIVFNINTTSNDYQHNDLCPNSDFANQHLMHWHDEISRMETFLPQLRKNQKWSSALTARVENFIQQALAVYTSINNILRGLSSSKTFCECSWGKFVAIQVLFKHINGLLAAFDTREQEVLDSFESWAANHTKLLQRTETYLQRLETIHLNVEQQSNDVTTLRDTVDNSNLEKVKRIAEDIILSLETEANRMRDTFATQRNDITGTLADVNEYLGVCKTFEAQADGVQKQLYPDMQYLLSVTENCRTRVSDLNKQLEELFSECDAAECCAREKKLTDNLAFDLCDAATSTEIKRLGTVVDLAENKHIPSITSTVENTAWCIPEMLQARAAIVGMSESIDSFASAQRIAQEHTRRVGYLRALPMAYDAAQCEIERRASVDETLRTRMADFAAEIRAMQHSENARRLKFVRRHGALLPAHLFPQLRNWAPQVVVHSSSDEETRNRIEGETKQPCTLDKSTTRTLDDRSSVQSADALDIAHLKSTIVQLKAEIASLKTTIACLRVEAQGCHKNVDDGSIVRTIRSSLRRAFGVRVHARAPQQLQYTKTPSQPTPSESIVKIEHSLIHQLTREHDRLANEVEAANDRLSLMHQQFNRSIVFRDFHKGDNMLFLQGTPQTTYVAFNLHSPHYYLSSSTARNEVIRTTSANRFPSFIVVHVLHIEPFVALDGRNPYRLHPGTTFYVVTGSVLGTNFSSVPAFHLQADMIRSRPQSFDGDGLSAESTPHSRMNTRIRSRSEGGNSVNSTGDVRQLHRSLSSPDAAMRT